MECEGEFYICGKCFRIDEVVREHHQVAMFHFPGYVPGHELLKPPCDRWGNMTSRAPRWFTEQRRVRRLGGEGANS